jgi:hypothetical protein
MVWSEEGNCSVSLGHRFSELKWQCDFSSWEFNRLLWFNLTCCVSRFMVQCISAPWVMYEQYSVEW